MNKELSIIGGTDIVEAHQKYQLPPVTLAADHIRIAWVFYILYDLVSNRFYWDLFWPDNSF